MGLKKPKVESMGFFNVSDMEEKPSNGVFMPPEESVAVVYSTATRRVSYGDVCKQLEALRQRKLEGVEHVFLNDELGLLKVRFDVCVSAVLETDAIKDSAHIPRFNEDCVQAQEVALNKVRRFLEAGNEYIDFLPKCQTEIISNLNTAAIARIGRFIDEALKLNVAKGALQQIKQNLRFIIKGKEISSLEHTFIEAVADLMPIYKSYKNKAAKKGSKQAESQQVQNDITSLLDALHLFRAKALMPKLYDEAAQSCQMVYDSCTSFFTYVPVREQIEANFKIVRDVLEFEDRILAGLQKYANTVSSWPVYNYSAGRVQAKKVEGKSKQPLLTIKIIRGQIEANKLLKLDDKVDIVFDLATGKGLLLKLQVRLMDLRRELETYKAEDNTRELEQGLAEARTLLDLPVFQKYDMLRLNAWENILEIGNNILIVLGFIKEFQPKPHQVEFYNTARDSIGSPNSSMYKRLGQQKLDFIEAIKVIKHIGANLNTTENRVFREFTHLYQNVHLAFLLLQKSLDYYEIIFKCIPQDRVAFKIELIKEQTEFIKIIQDVINILENTLGHTHIKRLFVKNKLGHSVLIDVQECNERLLKQGCGEIAIILGKKVEVVRKYYDAISFGFEKLLSELAAGQRDVTTEDYMYSFGASSVLPKDLEDLIREDEEEKAQKKLAEEKEKAQKKHAEEKERQKEAKRSQRSREKRLENKTSPDISPVVATVQAPEADMVPKCDADLRREFDKLLKNLYTKQADFTDLRSTLSALPKLINQAQNLELIFEVNSAMGDAYDMMAQKIHISSKTPVTRDRNGRPNGIRKVDKTYNYSKMASETLSCLEASINYYKYAEMVLQNLHGKIPEDRYNEKYRWLIVCMGERTIKLRELRQKFEEDSDFLQKRKKEIRKMRGEDWWNRGNAPSQVSLYAQALANSVEPFNKITNALDDFTNKLAQHKEDDVDYPEIDCGYVSHQYVSQKEELPMLAEPELSPEDEVETDERYKVTEQPTSLVTLHGAAQQMPNFAGNLYPSVQLTMPFPLYPPMIFPYPAMAIMPTAPRFKEVCWFIYKNDMMYVQRVWVPEYSTEEVVPYPHLEQLQVPYGLNAHFRTPPPPQTNMPPFANEAGAGNNYTSTGYVAQQPQQPQLLITCVPPLEVNRVKSQGELEKS